MKPPQLLRRRPRFPPTRRGVRQWQTRPRQRQQRTAKVPAPWTLHAPPFVEFCHRQVRPLAQKPSRPPTEQPQLPETARAVRVSSSAPELSETPASVRTRQTVGACPQLCTAPPGNRVDGPPPRPPGRCPPLTPAPQCVLCLLYLPYQCLRRPAKVSKVQLPARMHCCGSGGSRLHGRFLQARPGLGLSEAGNLPKRRFPLPCGGCVEG